MSNPELIGAASVSLIIIGWLAKLTWMFAQMSIQVNTMWNFQIRRSVSEAVDKGILTVNSPIKIRDLHGKQTTMEISDEAKAWMAELSKELRKFYNRLGRNLNDSQLLLEIERRYGKEILDKVCIPHGLFEGACLLIAAAVAKEGAAGISVE